jgi:large subunit ribosomal protein L17
MRHQRADWKLGRDTAHRRALLRNLVTSLILQERITTTVAKAKFLRPFAERVITLGKRSGEPEDVLHYRRQAAAFLKGPAAVKKLFETVSPRFGNRDGGYTRMTRLGYRKGDGAELAMVELVGSELKKRQTDKKKKKAEQQPQPEAATPPKS